MKVVAFIPFWEDYESNEFRIKKVAGRFLISYALEKLNNLKGLDQIYIYASNENFTKYIEPGLNYIFLQRPSFLDDENITIENIISEFLKEIDADIVLLMHPTSPLLKIQSIQKGLNSVKNDGFDSSFSAVQYNKLAWYHFKPINYSINDNTPKLNEIEPIHIEQSSLYIFKRKSFMKYKHRVSGKININVIDQIEGLEVRNKMDFSLLELIINSGMYEERYNEDI